MIAHARPLALALGAVLASLLCASCRQSAVNYRRAGTRLYEHGQYLKAYERYRLAEQADPKDYHAPYDAGLALEYLKVYRDAADEYRQSLRLNPSNARAHVRLGRVLVGLRDFDGAEQECRTALRLDPNSAFAHANLAYVLYDRGDLAAAIPEFQTALRLDPRDEYARIYLGLALYGTERPAEAADEFRSLLRLNPKSAPAWNGVGWELYRQGCFDEAAADFRNSYRINANQTTLIDLGDAATDRHRWKEAVRWYKAVLAADPHNEAVRVPLGLDFYNTGHKAGARAEWMQALNSGRWSERHAAQQFLSQYH